MNSPHHLLMSWDDLIEVCRDLAVRVARTYQPEVVVGIARTGTLPAVLIGLFVRAEVQSLRVPSSDGIVEVRPYLPAPQSVVGRRVLLVDEVSQSGAAIRWARSALQRLGAAEVRTVVLFSTDGGALTDFSGPKASATVLQPWIREVAIVDRELHSRSRSVPVGNLTGGADSFRAR